MTEMIIQNLFFLCRHAIIHQTFTEVFPVRIILSAEDDLRIVKRKERSKFADKILHGIFRFLIRGLCPGKMILFRELTSLQKMNSGKSVRFHRQSPLIRRSTNAINGILLSAIFRHFLLIDALHFDFSLCKIQVKRLCRIFKSRL